MHVVWELVLLLALAALAYLLWREDPDALRGAGLRRLLVDAVALGLLVLAAGLSLRTAAVNLAIGPVALAAALHFAEQGDRGCPRRSSRPWSPPRWAGWPWPGRWWCCTCPVGRPASPPPPG